MYDRRSGDDGYEYLTRINPNQHPDQDADQYNDPGDKPDGLVRGHDIVLGARRHACAMSDYVVSILSTSIGECLNVCLLPLHPMMTADRVIIREITKREPKSGTNARSK